MVATSIEAVVRYRSDRGDAAWRVAVEGGAFAVLSPEVTEATVEAIWRKIGGGGIGAVLEALTGAFGTSLAAIPPFALAVAEGSGIRVAVRGPVEVLVHDATGTHAVSGEGVATWAERFLPDAQRVSIVLGGGNVDAAVLPVRSGVVFADVVVATLGDVTPASAVPRSAKAAATAPDSATAVAPAAAAPAAPEPAAVAERAEPADEPADADVISVVPLVATAPVPAPPEPDAESAPELDAEPAAATPLETSADTWMPAATIAPDAEASAGDDDYDLLWGETVARPISAAASIAAAAEENAEPTPAAPAVPPLPPLPPVPAATSAQPVLGDHDGETVSVASVRALRAAEQAQFESTDNVPARRPTQGRIVLSTGRVVELERPVIIGRRPQSTRTSGSELPTLVAVDSPDQDISRSHVEIRAEGEHVLVTDLNTTNGTVLLRNGHDPVRLHPSEPTMVISGDVLDLGDDVTVTFEDLA